LPSNAPTNQITSSIFRNEGGGTIGSFNFTGNTVIGRATVLDNAGGCRACSRRPQFHLWLFKSGKCPDYREFWPNWGGVGTNNTIKPSEMSNSGSNRPQSTADSPPSVAPFYKVGGGAFIRTRGENSDLYFVENTANGNVFLDNSGRLDRTSITDNHISSTNWPGAPLTINNSGQTDHIYITNNDVQRTVPGNKSDSAWGNEAIPSGVLNGHGIQLRDGTFASAVPLSLTAPIKPGYVTWRSKGKICWAFLLSPTLRLAN
jgi:hypothetical protein